MSFSHDKLLDQIALRVASGERLSFEDGLVLYATDDLPAIGKLADSERRRRHGSTTYFNVNRHLNPTNICYADCKFCGFYRTPRQADAYTHNIDDSLRVAGQAIAEGATELHITGGLNTKLPFSYFTDLLSSLKNQYPQLHLKAFTMVEFDHFAHFYKMSDEDVIRKLIEAGLDSCPGGGAEIFQVTIEIDFGKAGFAGAPVDAESGGIERGVILVGRVEIGAITRVAEAEFVKFVGGESAEPTGGDNLRTRGRELGKVCEPRAAAVAEGAEREDLVGLAESIAGGDPAEENHRVRGSSSSNRGGWAAA